MPDDSALSYFAYGSNMAEQVMSVVAPSAKKISVARLTDHRLAFTRKSKQWGAGVADVVACPGFSVYGILYTVSPDDVARLDRKEGVPKAYRQIQVTVRSDHQSIGAFTYTVTEPESLEVRPRSDYLWQIVSAASANSFPKSYIEFLSYLQEVFSKDTRDDGLLLAPTADRQFSSGVPLIRIHPDDSGKIRGGSIAALIMGDRVALGRAELSDRVARGTCQADQTLRVCLGASGQFCFGNRITVLSSAGSRPMRSMVRPRTLVLPLYAMSRNDSEKNYCVLHQDRIKVLGLNEGDYVRLYAASAPCDDELRPVEVRSLTVRVFSGSASSIGGETSGRVYPDRSELYLDSDGRQRLGLPQSGWTGTPVLVRPAIWRALAGRAVFYGLTALLGIGAMFQLLHAFAPQWSLHADALIALAATMTLTFILSVVDLRARLRY